MCVRICVIVRLAGLPDGVLRLAIRQVLGDLVGHLELALVLQHQDRDPVTGLVIDAIQNSVSAFIGRFVATSASPVVSKCRTRSLVPPR